MVRPVASGAAVRHFNSLIFHDYLSASGQACDIIIDLLASCQGTRQLPQRRYFTACQQFFQAFHHNSPASHGAPSELATISPHSTGMGRCGSPRRPIEQSDHVRVLDDRSEAAVSLAVSASLVGRFDGFAVIFGSRVIMFYNNSIMFTCA